MSQATETKPSTKPRKTRQPVKPLNNSTESVAAQAKAERERKAASKAALKAAAKSKLVNELSKVDPNAARIVEAAEVLTRQLADAPTVSPEFLATLREDAIALGATNEDEIAAYIAEQIAAPKKQRYTGPMLALVHARKAYAKQANGNPACGDQLAMVCGTYSREVVVKGLIAALRLESNPYAHLNPGQQSMNLRNKARAALKNGLLQLAEVRAELDAAAVVLGAKLVASGEIKA